MYRWEPFGAPYAPPLTQAELNRLLSLWTTSEAVEEIALLSDQTKTRNIKEAERAIRENADIERHRRQIQATGHRIPIVPMQQVEVNDHLVNCRSKDEAAAITYLPSELEEPSVSSTMYKEWGLNRKIIEDRHKAMARDRVLHTTFNNLAGGARFQALQGSILMRAQCQPNDCSRIDSRAHFSGSCGVSDLAQLSRQERIDQIVKICRGARMERPNYPSPSSAPPREVVLGKDG